MGTGRPTTPALVTYPSPNTYTILQFCTLTHSPAVLDLQPSLSLFQLLLHVDAGALPQDLGGALDYDHLDWLAKCNQVAEAQSGSMLTMTHSTSQSRSPQDSPSLPDQVMTIDYTLTRIMIDL